MRVSEPELTPNDARANAKRWMTVGLWDIRRAARSALASHEGLTAAAQEMELHIALLGGEDPLYEVCKALRMALGALTWCSGSASFGPDGEAHAGWLQVAVPAIRTGEAALRLLDGRGPAGGDKPNG